MRNIILAVIFMMQFTMFSASAATRYVPSQYSTIQAAIDACVNDDIVIVSPGTYFENINFNGKNITLTSLGPNDSNIVASTIIDGNKTGSVVTFAGTEDANCLLTGFTITHGYIDESHTMGSGICGNNTHADVRKCNIIGNTAHMTNPTRGGGIANLHGNIDDCFIQNNDSHSGGGGLYNCDGAITNCSIINNYVPVGPGGGLDSCDGPISNCIIAYNVGDIDGGGLGYCNGAITNCKIIGNRTRHGDGGGIYCSMSGLYITNCIISANTTTNGPSDAIGDAKNGGDGGGIYCYESTVEINGSTLKNNTTGDGGDARSSAAGNGGSGGGIYCQGAYITLRNSFIVSNKTGESGFDSESQHGGHGGGIGCIDSQLRVAGCSIHENITGTHGGSSSSSTYKAISGFGGGIYALRSDLTIENSQIIKNATTGGLGAFVKNGGHGGGISLYSCSLTLTGTEIIENCTGNGGRTGQESGNGGNGAGIFLSSCSQIFISDCMIARNIAGSVVGGIAYAYGGNGGSGGGIYSYDSSPSINNCFVISNSGGNGGDAEAEPGDGGNSGGIYSSDTVTVVNCVIAKNNAGRGGDNYGPYHSMRGGNGGNGAGIYSPSATIINSTIVQNTTGIGGSGVNGGSDGLEGAGGGIYADSNSIIKNCILWENYQDEFYPPDCNIVSYSNVSGGLCAGSTGNISSLLLFADPDANDYHLLPDSPCINTGDPNYAAEPNETDLDGMPRVIDGRIDMGAYEYWPPLEVEMKFTPQTINIGSNSNCVKAHILLPEGLSVEDIDVNCPAVAGPMGTESQNMKVFENDQCRTVIECDFDRSAFCETLTSSGSLEVTVTGLLRNGREFTGSDTIKIIAPRKNENILHVRGCPPLYRLD